MDSPSGSALPRTTRRRLSSVSSTISDEISKSTLHTYTFITCNHCVYMNHRVTFRAKDWNYTRCLDQEVLWTVTCITWRGARSEWGCRNTQCTEKADLWHHKCIGGCWANFKGIKESHQMEVSLHCMCCEYTFFDFVLIFTAYLQFGILYILSVMVQRGLCTQTW